MRRKELWRKAEETAQEKGVKQYKYLYRRMLDENIIRKAYKKLRKGKTKRKEIQQIDADLDNEVAGRSGGTPGAGIQTEKTNPETYKRKGEAPEDFYAKDTRAMATPHNRPYFGADYNGHGLPIFLRQLPEAGRPLRKEAAFKNYTGRKEYPELCKDRHPPFLRQHTPGHSYAGASHKNKRRAFSLHS